MPSSYGPIFSAWDAEQAVRDTLKAWIDTFLGEIERQSSGRWTPRQIARPQSWFIQSAFHDIPEQQLPVIHVESATKTSRHADGGRVDGQWAMNVQGVVKGRNREASREMLGLYEAACSAILEKHGDLGGIASGVSLSGARYDLIPPSHDRTLVGFEIPIIVSVDHIADRFGGPDQPDPPTPDPLPVTSPSDPEHLSTHVQVTGVPAGWNLTTPTGPPPGDPTGGNVSVVFSMPTAVIGESGPYTVRTATFVERVTLSCVTAPVGAPLTVEAMHDGELFATLTIPAGSTLAQSQTLSLAVRTGDQLAVVATSVGTTTAATGVSFQIDLNDD